MGGEGHSQNVRPRPDFCKLGETNQRLHFENVRHPPPHHGLLPYTQNTLQNGEVEAFENHMSGTKSQAFRRKKKKKSPQHFGFHF